MHASFILLLVTFKKKKKSEHEAKKDLYILGIMPNTGYFPVGKVITLSTAMALKNINEREDILREYKLNLVTLDSQGNPGYTVYQLSQFLHQPPIKIMIYGQYYTFRLCNSFVQEELSLPLHKQLLNVLSIGILSRFPMQLQVQLYPIRKG